MALSEFTRLTGKTLRDVARALSVRPELVASVTSMELPPLTQSGVTPLFPGGHLRLA
jgi:hypothetical protein